ncbi:MAG TPA: CHAT domain-containing protein [Anaerolineaceae bacterium]|nr:CHAT domain-containing protein [Anaerolineaceae bacterium]
MNLPEDLFADLEIWVYRYDSQSYRVDFRFSHPNSEVDIRPGANEVMLAQFDLDALRAEGDPDTYGELLTSSLFSSEGAKSSFREAVASAQTAGENVRVRLFVDPFTPELNSLYWETLRDPNDQVPLCMKQKMVFSRYLTSRDWEPVRLRSRSNLQALALISSPKMDTDRFPPIDIAAETSRLCESLGNNIPVTILNQQSQATPASLEAMADQLQKTPYDVLCFICHGFTKNNETHLLLETSDGSVDDEVSTTRLVERLIELGTRPRLIVLIACQTAGKIKGDMLLSLGPKLVEAGIPAVLAMQGNLSFETGGIFLKEFFQELQQNGLIDRAVASGRAMVSHQPDYWMPALFMRLRSGSLWYTAGFRDADGSFQRWDALRYSIQGEKCSPIIGPGLTESWFGGERELALRWAQEFNYPMAVYDREDLPRVAQFLATDPKRGLNPGGLRIRWMNEMSRELTKREGEGLTADLRESAGKWMPPSLAEAMRQATDFRWSKEPNEAHLRLARLDLPVFITTSPLDLLALALKKQGKDPQVRISPWNDAVPRTCPELAKLKEIPSPQRPLVYHLFGHINQTASIVLSEDDYLDFLIGLARNRDLVPGIVKEVMASNSLLFLGFKLEEWKFRILFRYLHTLGGSQLRHDFSHIAAQLEPEEERLTNSRMATDYLEKYFGLEQIYVYWGSVDEFFVSFDENMKEMA